MSVDDLGPSPEETGIDEKEKQPVSESVRERLADHPKLKIVGSIYGEVSFGPSDRKSSQSLVALDEGVTPGSVTRLMDMAERSDFASGGLVLVRHQEKGDHGTFYGNIELAKSVLSESGFEVTREVPGGRSGPHVNFNL